MDVETVAGVAGVLLALVGLCLTYLQLRVSRTTDPGRNQPSVAARSRRAVYQDWGAAVERELFTGRTQELAYVTGLLSQNTAAIVAVTGPAGIGKSRFALEAAHELVTARPRRYDVVIWRSLKDGMGFSILAGQLITILSNGTEVSSADEQTNVNKLATLLQKTRLLLILDNAESILEPGPVAGRLAPAFAAYESLFALFMTRHHESSIILTGRELPGQLSRAGTVAGGPVTIVRLAGIDPASAEQLIAHHSVTGPPEVVLELCQRLGFNPLKLRLAASSAAEVFDGDLSRYLRSVDRSLISGEVGQLVLEQLSRTDQLSRDILYWLAVERGPVSVEALRASMLREPDADLTAALSALYRRSMIERVGPGTFTLQPAVAEFLLGNLVHLLAEEIATGSPDRLHTLALLTPDAALFLQAAQLRYGIEALLRRCGVDSDPGLVVGMLNRMLGRAVAERPRRSYLVGNLINILTQVGEPLAGRDLSHSEIRRADLKRANIQGANVAGSHFDRCTFYQALSSIHAVALDPTDRFIAVGGSSGDTWLLNREGLKEFGVLSGHTDWIRAIEFHPTEPLLVTASDDETVRVWNYETREELHRLRRHEGKVTALAFDRARDLLLTAGEDGMVVTWSATTWQQRDAVRVAEYGLWAIALSPDGDTLAVGGEDNTIQLWDCRTMAPSGHLVGSPDWIGALAFHPDTGELVSGGRDGTVRVWDIRTGGAVRRMDGFGEWIWSVDCSADAIAAAYGDGTIRMWRGGVVLDLAGHSQRAWCVRFFPDGADLVSGGEDHAVRAWSAASGDCTGAITGSISPLFAIDARQKDGQVEILSGGEDGELRSWSWDGTAHTLISSAHAHRGRVWETLFGHGDEVLTTGEDGVVRRWTLPIRPNGSEALATLGEQIWALDLVGDLIVAAGEEHVFLIDRAAPHAITTLQGGYRGWTWCLASDHSGRFLATGSYDKVVRWWDVQAGQLIGSFARHRAPVVGLAWSEPTGWLLTGGYDGAVRFWNPRTDAHVDGEQAHSGPIWAAAASPSGTRFATACGDRTIVIWDAATCRPMFTLHGHQQWVQRPVFLSDRLLISSSTDGSIKIWDLDQRTCLDTLMPPRVYEGTDFRGATGLRPLLDVLSYLGGVT